MIFQIRRVRQVLLAAAALAAAGCEGAPRAPQVGEPAPAYAAVTADGKPVSLEDLRGRPVLLNVWATWCHPCREELPDLQRLHETHSAQGLRIVGVSVDEAGQEASVQRFAREHGVTYDLWLDPGERVASAFATVGVPTTVLIAPDGTLLWRHVGPVKADDPELTRLLQQALASRPQASASPVSAASDSAAWCDLRDRERLAGSALAASSPLPADSICAPGTSEPLLPRQASTPDDAAAAFSALGQ